jgi:hypothetical protein
LFFSEASIKVEDGWRPTDSKGFVEELAGKLERKPPVERCFMNFVK